MLKTTNHNVFGSKLVMATLAAAMILIGTTGSAVANELDPADAGVIEAQGETLYKILNAGFKSGLTPATKQSAWELYYLLAVKKEIHLPMAAHPRFMWSRLQKFMGANKDMLKTEIGDDKWDRVADWIEAVRLSEAPDAERANFHATAFEKQIPATWRTHGDASGPKGTAIADFLTALRRKGKAEEASGNVHAQALAKCWNADRTQEHSEFATGREVPPEGSTVSCNFVLCADYPAAAAPKCKCKENSNNNCYEGTALNPSDYKDATILNGTGRELQDGVWKRPKNKLQRFFEFLKGITFRGVVVELGIAKLEEGFGEALGQ